MSVIKPYLVLLCDGDILRFLVRSAFIDGYTVGYLFSFLNGEEIVGHGLIGEFVDEGTEEVHAAIEDVEGAPWSVSRWWEVVVEFGVEVQFVLG